MLAVYWAAQMADLKVKQSVGQMVGGLAEMWGVVKVEKLAVLTVDGTVVSLVDSRVDLMVD